MSILRTIIIGFIVGMIAKFLMPCDKYEPKGFIVATILGIVGAFVATYLGGMVGAIILLAVYGFFAVRQGRAT